MNYLQLQVQVKATNNNLGDRRVLTLIASGGRKVFEDCEIYFNAFANQSFNMN